MSAPALKLYEQADSILDLLESVQEAGGELDEETDAKLEALELALDEKVERICMVRRSLEVEAEALKKEAKRLTARAKSREGRAEWLKGYLHRNLERIGRDRVDTLTFSVQFQPSPASCEYHGELSALPEQFRTAVPASERLDKKALLDHWRETGEIPDGVVIHTPRHIRIR